MGISAPVLFKHYACVWETQHFPARGGFYACSGLASVVHWAAPQLWGKHMESHIEELLAAVHEYRRAHRQGDPDSADRLLRIYRQIPLCVLARAATSSQDVQNAVKIDIISARQAVENLRRNSGKSGEELADELRNRWANRRALIEEVPELPT